MGGPKRGCYGSTQLGIVALSRSWCKIFSGKRGKRKKRKGGEKEEHIRDAHIGVQSSDERAEGAQFAAPSPRAPQPCHTV